MTEDEQAALKAFNTELMGVVDRTIKACETELAALLRKENEAFPPSAVNANFNLRVRVATIAVHMAALSGTIMSRALECAGTLGPGDHSGLYGIAEKAAGMGGIDVEVTDAGIFSPTPEDRAQ